MSQTLNVSRPVLCAAADDATWGNEPLLPSWAILVRTSVVVRRSWSTYATDTAPLARSATAPLSQEQGIQAQPNRPVTAPVTGHFLPLLRLATLFR